MVGYGGRKRGWVRIVLGILGAVGVGTAAVARAVRTRAHRADAERSVDAAFDAVTKAGGVVAKPIFSFPGGRRFHFRDPSGNELAVWQKAKE